MGFSEKGSWIWVLKGGQGRGHRGREILDKAEGAAERKSCTRRAQGDKQVGEGR